jgi:nicotinamide-nucleotide amidase
MTANDTGDDEDRVVQQLAALLAQSDRWIGVAESLTGGLLVQALARQPGSGDWLTGGIVAYQRSVKHGLLDVSADKVVSSEAAAQMASSVRARLGCDIGMAVTGVAGPEPQDDEPPGTVWMAVDVGDGPATQLLQTEPQEPEEICRLTVLAALRFVLRQLDPSLDDTAATDDDS